MNPKGASMDDLAESLTWLAARERQVLEWLARENNSEHMKHALENELRRIRAQQRLLMLRQIQNEPETGI